METLFKGPYFDYVMSQEPLCGADYFKHGSFSMLFQRDGKLYRLTTDGQGHNFLSEQSTNGNPIVVRVIQNFGPVAPSDDDYLSSNDEYYWLAEVEWLQPLDVASVEGQFLEQLLSDLTDDDRVEPHQRETFLERCKAAASLHTKYRDFLNTLIEAANYLPNDDGTVDANITNVMRRPSTGEIVWSDPVHCTPGVLTDRQEEAMERIRRLIEQQN